MRAAAVLIGSAAALVLVGCGSSEEAARFEVESPWSRPTPTGATGGVAYLTISSDVDDQLIAVEVPTDLAAGARIHGSMVDGSPGGHHGDGTGETQSMSESEVDGLAVPAGQTIRFEPGGNHIMLVDLVEPLRLGEHFSLTLRFESGRALTADVVVADNPPS